MKKAAGASLLFVIVLLFAFMVNVERAVGGVEDTNVDDSLRDESKRITDVNDRETAESEGSSGAAVSETDVVPSDEKKEDETDVEEDGVKDDEKDDEKEEEKKKVEIPDSVPMAMGFQENTELPKKFRGGDPDKGFVNCLEDVKYTKHEHSLAYTDNPDDVASGTKFESDPVINWTTKETDENGDVLKDENGEDKVVEETNSNMATDGGKFYNPGHYQIGNSGARQVSDGDDKKTVTTSQNTGVKVFDVTPPDLWVGFQEVAGQHADSEEAMKALTTNMDSLIVLNQGRALDANKGHSVKAGESVLSQVNSDIFGKTGTNKTKKTLAQMDNYTSYLFFDEGKIAKEGDENNERNLEPNKKVARLTLSGILFDKDGKEIYKEKSMPTLLLDKEEQTRLAQFKGMDEEDNPKDDENHVALYVRRNVPVIFKAVAVDNGSKRMGSSEDPKDSAKYDYKAEASIVNSNGDDVQEDGVYMFRRANFPEADYPDSEVFTFKARSVDKTGNITEVALPVYVVDDLASFNSVR